MNTSREEQVIWSFKIKLFMDELPMKANLQHKYPELVKDSVCLYCNKKVETNAHFIIYESFLETIGKKLIIKIKKLIITNNLKMSQETLINRISQYIIKMLSLQIDQSRMNDSCITKLSKISIIDLIRGLISKELIQT